jgi:hypothetical protein
VADATNPSDLEVRTAPAATPTASSVAASVTVVTILAANPDRYGATVFNDSTADMYLKFGASASTTSFNAKLRPDGYIETPYGYVGIVTAVWTSATGNARVGEFEN